MLGKKLIVFLLMMLMILSGCSQDKEVVQEEPFPVEVEEEVPVEEEVKELPYQFPLTGIRTETEPTNRPVAVMINNHPSARPQSGLHQADIVYEVLAEGNVTRFLAIFASETPEMIGPVRSARDYYIELAKGYDGFYIAHGYSPSAKQMLDSGFIDHLNGIRYDGILFERANFRRAPHNSYISFENILKGANESQFNMEQIPESLSFLDETEIENLIGQQVEDVLVSYGNQTFDARYVYDNETNKYHRFSAGERTADYDTEAVVQLDNVMIIEMNHRILDNEGRRAIDLTSGGQGYLLQRGMLNEVTWRNVGGRILPFIDGNPAELVPGKTWINIVPSLDRVTF